MAETAETTKAPAKHDWHEIGRVFPFLPEHQDVDELSPHGGHIVAEDGSSELVPASHPKMKGKVPAVKPHVILQCQDEDCPDGPKAIIHVELTEDEWKPLKAAIENGNLDPDRNGTNTMMSTASLTDLGLGRIEKMLGPGRKSGANAGILDV